MVNPGSLEYRETRMSANAQSGSLFAAVHVTEFPAQAILRLRHDLRSFPCVVLDGRPPEGRVCALNQYARRRGVVAGMTRLEIEELGGIHLSCRSLETEANARDVLLETLSQFSPRIEEPFSPNACAFVLDITGTERLFGPSETIAQHIRNTLSAAGFHASISVSSNFHAARIKSQFSRGVSVVPNNKEAMALASIPISALQLELDHYETFALWGITTLGELAALPEEELIPRFGQQSRRWLSLSRGSAEHTFQPIETRLELKEHIEFDHPVEQLESLLFIGSTMIDNLASRASQRALSIACVRIEMSLDKSPSCSRVIRPAIPSQDRKFLLKLLHLEIAAHPTEAAVMSLTMTAEAGHRSKMQLGLFAPQFPEPSRLDVTLARLKVIVGSDRVGSPALLNTHKPNSFVLREFAIPDKPGDRPDFVQRSCLRRIRPPRALQIQINSGVPTAFSDGTAHYQISVAYGPWESSGCWWATDRWNFEEWDVMAMSCTGESIACLLLHDQQTGKWLLDAFYD
jgi:protein ImuB